MCLLWHAVYRRLGDGWTNRSQATQSQTHSLPVCSGNVNGVHGVPDGLGDLPRTHSVLAELGLHGRLGDELLQGHGQVDKRTHRVQLLVLFERKTPP